MKIKKTESTPPSCEPLGRFVSALVMVSLLGVVLPAFAQQGYEAPPVLSASKILPPELLSGPNHRVRERVTNDGYLNTYQIDSKFGTFTAVSTALLRKRIGEINAMVVMEKVQDSKEYIDSFKEAGLDAMTSAMSLVTSPVQTLSGAAQGLGAAFERVGGTLFGAERSGSEEARIKDAIGFAATKRRICVSVRRGCLFGKPKDAGHVEQDFLGRLRRFSHMVRSHGSGAGRGGYRHDCRWQQQTIKSGLPKHSASGAAENEYREAQCHGRPSGDH